MANPYHRRGRFSSRGMADLVVGVTAANRTGARMPSENVHDRLIATGRSTPRERKPVHVPPGAIDRTPLNPALESMLRGAAANGSLLAAHVIRNVPNRLGK